LLATSLFALALLSQPPRAVIPGDSLARALRAERELQLDGRLTEPEWARADSVTDFTQRDPSEGQPASERTVVRFVASASGLWVGVQAYDRDPGGIVHAQLRRDADIDEDDFFGLAVDGLQDRRSGFIFGVNANGALFDSEIVNFENDNSEWDGIWDARAHITDVGWEAELFIPWQTLRYRPGETDFRINMVRGIARKNEQALWRAWRRSEGPLFLERYGTLTGLEQLPGRSSVELRPYALATSRFVERSFDSAGTATVVAPSRQQLQAGVDAKVGIAGGLTLDLTYNTDFAQVDADRQVVNLTRFPLSFPETRPFFLESAGIFDFGRLRQTQLFYSRRIGLDEQGRSIPITAGARLTGRLGSQQVGLLAVRSGGQHDATDVVARVKQDVLGRGYVGAMLVGRDAAGVPLSASGGVDFNLPYIIRNQNLVVIGSLAAHRDSAGAPVAGYGRFIVDYPNDHADIVLRYDLVGMGFEPALGFVEQSGVSRFAGQVVLTPRPRRWGIRRFDFALPSWNWVRYADGSLSNARIEVRPLGAEFEDGSGFELNLTREYDVPNERFELFPGTEIDSGRYVWNRVEVQYESRPSLPIVVDLSASAGSFYDADGKSLEVSVSGRLQPHLRWSADAEWQRVTLGAARFTARVQRLRVDYAVNARLNATAFGQYDNESRRVALNARVRWTTSPGSDAYVVWNSVWPSGLESGIPWRRPVRGALVIKYSAYFRT
jgi:hypothetical protein